MFSILADLLLGQQIGIVLTHEQIVIDFGRADEDPLVVPNTTLEPPPYRVSKRLTTEHPDIYEALKTRAHSRKRQLVPMIARGQIQYPDLLRDRLQSLLKAGGAMRWRIKPIVVVASPLEMNIAVKRTLIQLLDEAGARRVFLTEFLMASAIGLGLPVVEGTPFGMMSLHGDGASFGVISYAAPLVERFIPLGINDLFHELQVLTFDTPANAPAEEDSHRMVTTRGIVVPTSDDLDKPDHDIWASACHHWLRRLALHIQDALTDLTDDQFAKLAQSGIHLCGPHSTIPNLATAISAMVGIPIHIHATDVPPAIKGNRQYLNHLAEWKQTIDNDAGDDHAVE